MTTKELQEEAKLKAQIKNVVRSANEKQKGIYVITKYSWLNQMVHTKFLEAGIGDAGLKRDDEGDIDSRMDSLSNSKDLKEDKITIDRILNPGHRDTELHKIIRENTASQRKKKNGKRAELFLFPIPQSMINHYANSGEFQDILKTLKESKK